MPVSSGPYWIALIVGHTVVPVPRAVTVPVPSSCPCRVPISACPHRGARTSPYREARTLKPVPVSNPYGGRARTGTQTLRRAWAPQRLIRAALLRHRWACGPSDNACPYGHAGGLCGCAGGVWACRARIGEPISFARVRAHMVHWSAYGHPAALARIPCPYGHAGVGAIMAWVRARTGISDPEWAVQSPYGHFRPVAGNFGAGVGRPEPVRAYRFRGGNC